MSIVTKFLLIAVLAFIGCSSEKDDNGRSVVYGVQIVTEGECQYVVIKSGRGIAMCHHAACNNPIHKTQTLMLRYNEYGEVSIDK